MSSDASNTTRRSFLKTSAGVTLGTAIAGTLVVPLEFTPGANETMRIGLIGCGERGTGAAGNALAASPHNVLTAVGDTFEDTARSSLKGLAGSSQ